MAQARAAEHLSRFSRVWELQVHHAQSELPLGWQHRRGILPHPNRLQRCWVVTCAGPRCQAAASLVSRNEEREPKSPVTTRGAGEKIQILELRDEEDEAR